MEKKQIYEPVEGYNIEDIIKHGCPHCNYRSSYNNISTYSYSMHTCGSCQKGFTIVHKKEGLNNMILEHPLKQNLAKGREDKRPNVKNAEYFATRGVGLENLEYCIYCNDDKNHGLVNNISGFIRTYEAGERLLKWFKPHPDKENVSKLKKLGVYLDYRENYPDRIQFKIGACNDHLNKLKALNLYVAQAGYISKDLINKSNRNYFDFIELFKLYLNAEEEMSTEYLLKAQKDEDIKTASYREGHIQVITKVKEGLTLFINQDLKDSDFLTFILDLKSEMNFIANSRKVDLHNELLQRELTKHIPDLNFESKFSFSITNELKIENSRGKFNCLSDLIANLIKLIDIAPEFCIGKKRLKILKKAKYILTKSFSDWTI